MKMNVRNRVLVNSIYILLTRLNLTADFKTLETMSKQKADDLFYKLRLLEQYKSSKEHLADKLFQNITKEFQGYIGA